MMNETLITEDKETNDDGVNKLFYKVWEHRLEKAWNHFNDAGFKPILIKGWAASQFYPNPPDRKWVDIDLIIEPSQFKAAEDFMKREDVGVLVDLHKGARHLDELSFENLFENSIFKKCGNTNVRVPCDEDHLRIICVHWLNDGGEDRDRLEDIYFAVLNRSEKFDWERCLNSVTKKRRTWVVSAIVITNKYLDLPLEGIPLTKKDCELPNWLTNTLENEWGKSIRLKPLHSVLGNKKEFRQQLEKRLLPNPIQATIEVGGVFDNRPRVIYQFHDILKRSIPSLKKLGRTYWTRLIRK